MRQIYFNSSLKSKETLVGAVADFAGDYREFEGDLDGDTVKANASLHTFLFGPRFSGSRERVRPFAQAIFRPRL